jgi:hypothetical protein
MCRFELANLMQTAINASSSGNGELSASWKIQRCCVSQAEPDTRLIVR